MNLSVLQSLILGNEIYNLKIFSPNHDLHVDDSVIYH